MDYANWPRCERLVPHALAARGWIESEDLRVPEAARLLNQAGYYLYLRARYAEAEPLFRRALAIREAALGPDHPDTATSLNNLAVLLRAQGRYAEAEPLLRRALAIREAALGPDHPDTAISLNNLAVLLQAQGRYAEAEPLSAGRWRSTTPSGEPPRRRRARPDAREVARHARRLPKTAAGPSRRSRCTAGGSRSSDSSTLTGLGRRPASAAKRGAARPGLDPLGLRPRRRGLGGPDPCGRNP